MKSRLVPASSPSRLPIQTPIMSSLGFYSDRKRGDGRDRSAFRCAYCEGTNTLRAFPVVYANGSSISRYRRGLILKTGWAETRRQSDLARSCSPPRRRRLFWRISIALVALAGVSVGKGARIPFAAAYDVSEFSGVLAILAVLLIFNAIRWNQFKYPVKMEGWQNSYFCTRCARVSVIERVNEN